MLRSLQQWLRLHLASWNPQLRDRWGLSDLAAMNVRDYPVGEASLNPDEELQQLKSVPPLSMDELGMRIRDIFWGGVTVESTIICPRCRETQLRILEDPPSNAIVLSCDLCA